MPINRRVCFVDYCISDIVAALNASNITTEASCCGHGQINGTILLEDGRILVIHNVKREQKPGSEEWQKIIDDIGKLKIYK